MSNAPINYLLSFTPSFFILNIIKSSYMKKHELIYRIKRFKIQKIWKIKVLDWIIIRCYWEFKWEFKHKSELN